MKIEKTKCDCCSVEVEDDYSEIGWINLNGEIRISNGRNKAGGASTIVYEHAKKRDFCSIDCLTQYLKKQVAAGKRKLKRRKNET